MSKVLQVWLFKSILWEKDNCISKIQIMLSPSLLLLLLLKTQYYYHFINNITHIINNITHTISFIFFFYFLFLVFSVPKVFIKIYINSISQTNQWKVEIFYKSSNSLCTRFSHSSLSSFCIFINHFFP